MVQISRMASSGKESSINNVLRGGFMTEDYNKWKIPSFNLSYFVSSTFTDSHYERNVILSRLLPELTKISQPHGIAITFIDMRWGVKDENTDDHMTWDACKAELQKCINESCETFFISLQGYKYGYRPLPKEIDQIIFDHHINNYNDVDKDELIELAKKWYILDTNSIPRKYVLTKLNDNNRSDYWDYIVPNSNPPVFLPKALSKLLKLFNGLIFEDNLYIGDSVTNWEAIYALNNDTHNNRIFWMRREIVDTITDKDDVWKEFNDSRDSADIRERLNKLLDTMKNKLEAPNNHVHTTTIDNLLSIKNKNEACIKYIEEFYNKLKLLLTSEVDHVIRSKQAWLNNAYNTKLHGDMCTDFLHHYTWARLKVKDFVGRDDLIANALRLICESQSGFDICCGIVGKSGCGKTSFMAKLAALLYESTGIPVIIRFCGTNENSTSGLKLLKSIVNQMHYIYDINDVTVQEGYAEIVDYFKSLVATYPVILLVDSIDQLSNDNQERSKISFLNGIKPHHQSKIIVSCLPDDYDEINKIGYWYGCHNTLLQWNVPQVDITSITSDSLTILDSYLHNSNRTLTSSQKAVVLDSIKQQEYPTALFIKLATRVACSWTSSEVVCVIPPTVPLLINQIFNEIQRKFGKMLVNAIIAFITLSINGIVSSEMVDLLSLDDKVLEEVNGKYMIQANAATRLPLHVWLRVQNELSGLIVDQGSIKWYHRQLWETAEKRFNDDEKKYYHEILGKYFSNMIPNALVQSKFILEHELMNKNCNTSIWYTSSNQFINHRRCIGGYHLTKASLYNEAIIELCNLEMVCGYVKTGNTFLLINNLALIINNYQNSKYYQSEFYNRAYHYWRWLQQQSSFILLDVEANIIGTAYREPFESFVRKDAENLLFVNNKNINIVDIKPGDDIWLQKRVMGASTSFGACIMNLVGDTSGVLCIALNSDQCIASGTENNNIKVWNQFGECINMMSGHSGSVQCVYFSPNGTQLLSGSRDNTLRLWDLRTGMCLKVLNGHSNGINAVIFINSSAILSASDDTTIKLWDITNALTLTTYVGHKKSVTSLAVSSDSTRFFTGSEDKTVKIWNTITGKSIKTLRHDEVVTSVKYHSFSKIISASDENVYVWNSFLGTCLATIKCHDANISSISISPSGDKLMTTSWDSYVKIWDLKTQELLSTLKEHTNPVSCGLFSSDGKCVLTGSFDETVRVSMINISTNEDSTPHSSDIIMLVIRPDLVHLATSSYDGTIKIWETISGKLLWTLSEYHSEPVSCISFSPDGKKLISGSFDLKAVLYTVDNEGYHPVFTTKLPKGFQTICFTKDGSKIIVSCQIKAKVTILVYNGYTGERIQLFEMKCIDKTYDSTKLCVNTTGSIIITGFISDSLSDIIEIWDAINIKLKSKIESHNDDKISAMSLSPDDSLLVTGFLNGIIKLWKYFDSTCVLTFKAHNDSINEIIFSTDGSRIISDAEDNRIKIFDSTNGQCMISIKTHSSYNQSVYIAENNLFLAMSSGADLSTLHFA